MGLSKDLIAASAEPLILSILSKKESYGYALIKVVKSVSRGDINWTEGMLYPVLHRLERRGFIQSSWDTKDTGRKRKYYRILDKGMKHLQHSLQEWKSANAAILSVQGQYNV